MRKVRIISQPNAAYGGNISQGLNSNQYTARYHPEMMSEPDIKTRRLLQPVAREGANVEAEKGETVVTNFNGDSIPEHYNIGGKRHTQGGTPLNLPEDSFIFSDTKNMRIKDPNVLQMFGKSSGSFTPAELAKKYNINKYRATLGDPDTDKIQKESAERMIASYNKKLAKLALIQESMKGFPQGIPKIAEPYMATSGMDPNQFLSAEGANSQDVPDVNAAYGGYMQDGGSRWEKFSNEKDPSTGYWNRVQEANLFQRPTSKSVDPRMNQAFEKLIPFYGEDATGVGDYLHNLFTIPQNEINNLMTGYYEPPSATVSRYKRTTQQPMSSSNKFLLDVATDPMMYPELPYALGKGAIKGAIKLTPKIAAGAKIAAEAVKKYGTKAGAWLAKNAPEGLYYLNLYGSRIGQAALHAPVDEPISYPTADYMTNQQFLPPNQSLLVPKTVKRSTPAKVIAKPIDVPIKVIYTDEVF